VDAIVGLLARHPAGLRAEQIRDALHLQSKELPRPLREALASGRITKTGEKRATTYRARGAGGASSSASAGGGRASRGGKSAKRAARRGRPAGRRKAAKARKAGKARKTRKARKGAKRGKKK
jgi:hypothetical protein